MRNKPSEYGKEFYKKLNPILGISSKVIGYADETNTTGIDILSCVDPIDENVIFYGTIALNEQASHNEYEILMASYTKNKYIPNILSTCAFYIIKNKWKTKWGNVFEKIVEEYYPKSAIKHLYFTIPYIWEEKLEGFKVKEKSVKFLFAVGITDSELEYINKNGYKEFENRLEENNVDVFDIKRKSII
jgi:hypothetical protein